MSNQAVKPRKWLYPVLYAAFFVISMLPLYTEKPYLPQATQDVLISLLKVATTPYKAYAPIFHVLTFLLVALIAWRPARMGRLLAGYKRPLGWDAQSHPLVHAGTALDGVPAPAFAHYVGICAHAAANLGEKRACHVRSAQRVRCSHDRSGADERLF
jgi:hypothetical protein